MVKLQIRRGNAIIAEKIVDTSEVGNIADIFPEYADEKLSHMAMVAPENYAVKDFDAEKLDEISTIYFSLK